MLRPIALPEFQRRIGLGAPRALGLLLLAASVFAQAIPDLGFTTRVSARLIAQYARKFGTPAPDRLAQWIAFAAGQKISPLIQRLELAPGREADALQIVNDTINAKVNWTDDMSHWGVDDYWATPAESVASAGGDCEDFSIAKYFTLRALGVNPQELGR